MGASMALAGFGLTSCRRPESHLVPFSKSVEWTIPGKALYYATAMPRRTGAIPLIAATVDGRPIKLEGNPLHPASGGATMRSPRRRSSISTIRRAQDVFAEVKEKRRTERGASARDARSRGLRKISADLRTKIAADGGAGRLRHQSFAASVSTRRRRHRVTGSVSVAIVEPIPDLRRQSQFFQRAPSERRDLAGRATIR